MTVLAILGAAGTIGRVLIREMLAADESLRVVAVSRRAGSAFAGLSRCEELEGNVLDPKAVDRVVRTADLVVNLAARNPVGVRQDWAARRDFFLVNSMGAGLVAAAARRQDVPLIHFSTVSVYETAAYASGRLLSEGEEMPRIGAEVTDFYDRCLETLWKRVASPKPGRFDESTHSGEQFPYEHSCPENAPIYGLSKLIGERLVLALCRKVCCLRLSDVYGPGHESRGVIIEHLHQLGPEKVAQVNFGFRTSICFIYISDIARLLAQLIPQLLRDSSSVPGVINFSGERITAASMRSHLAQFCDMRNLPWRIELAPLAQPQVDRRYSREVFRSTFPTIEQTPFAKGLQLTFDAPQDAP